MTLGHDGFLGVDGGAYLLGRNAVLGDEPTGAGFPRPPLAPGWLLVPFTQLAGDDIGYKLWSCFASLAPVAPVYLLARRIGHGLPTIAPSAFAAGFLMVDLLHAEMIVTGALPLLGFGLLGMVWWAMGILAERWSWRAAAILIVCLGLIPWVNQTTAGLAIVTIPVYLLALAWFHRNSVIFKRILPPLALGGLIALGALPWYLQVLPVTGMLRYPGPFIFFTHMYDSAWWQFLLAWPLGIWMIRKAEEPWLKSLGVVICLLGTLLVFLSTDETIINVFYRSRYLLAVPVYVGLAWAICKYGLPNLRPTVVAVGTALALAVMLTGYIDQFHRQSDYSRMATPETVEALSLIRARDPEGAIINNSFTLALWISALNQVESPHTWTWTPPRRFVDTDKAVRCVLGWVPGCNPSNAAQELNARHILLEERFPFYNSRAPGVWGAPDAADPWGNLPSVPWLTEVYRQGTTVVYAIKVVPPTRGVLAPG